MQIIGKCLLHWVLNGLPNLDDHEGERASLFMHEQLFSECTYVCVGTASSKLGFSRIWPLLNILPIIVTI